MSVKWSKDLETGIPFVDSDHKILVNLIGQTSHCLSTREDSQILSSILSTLVEYIDFHFSREEMMMEVSNYHGIREHKREHLKLANKVRELYYGFGADSESISAAELSNFLNEWLIEHIMGTDFLYRDSCLSYAMDKNVLSRVPFQNGNGTDIKNNAPDYSLMRVMLVDDNENFRTLVKTILKAAGITNIDCIASPLDAIDKLNDRPADVVLCDCVMDEMSGPAFAEKIKEMGIPSKIVLLTGYNNYDIRNIYPDHDIAELTSGLLEKPVTPSMLINAILNSLSVSSSYH